MGGGERRGNSNHEKDNIIYNITMIKFKYKLKHMIIVMMEIIVIMEMKK